MAHNALDEIGVLAGLTTARPKRPPVPERSATLVRGASDECVERNDFSENLSGLRILVVKDSWHLGKALKGLLQDYGEKVAGPVATSADAQRLVSEQPPDAPLVDFSLRND